MKRQHAIHETLRQMRQRDALFRRFGYDSVASRKFVLEKAMPLPGHVLEIGTGKGRFLAVLAKHADRITTLDADAKQQRAANSPAAQKAAADQQKMQQQFAGKAQLQSQGWTERAAGDVIRHSLEAAGTSEAVTGEPGGVGFGGSDLSA